LACWLETAGLIKEKGYTPVWVLGPAETELKAQLAAHGVLDRHMWTTADLTVLCGRLEQVGGFIGHDSGLSHLAAFLGLPVLAIFGPSDPRRWKPWGPRVSVLRADLKCQPCFETSPENCPEDTCRTALKAPTIARALRAIGKAFAYSY
jgi:ADP-heptose:LPS heptosyltransferase